MMSNDGCKPAQRGLQWGWELETNGETRWVADPNADPSVELPKLSLAPGDPNPSLQQFLAYEQETTRLLREKGKRAEAEVSCLRLWIDSVGRTCPSNATIDAFLLGEGEGS